MTDSRVRSIWRGFTARHLVPALAIGVACFGTGCFTVQHQLPKGSYFGTLPAQAGERVTAFDSEASKNWFLAGLVPYTDFGVQDLAPAEGNAPRIQGLEVETRFSEFDVFISVIPGLFYGYYIWAPRTVRIKGQQVLTE